MELEPLADKWRSFRWNVVECDGNNVEDFLRAMSEARNFKGRPSVVIARTIMGKGVSFMEDDYRWHGVPPSPDQGQTALSELAPTKFGDFVEFEWEKSIPTMVK
jgi:transketolase